MSIIEDANIDIRTIRELLLQIPFMDVLHDGMFDFDLYGSFARFLNYLKSMSIDEVADWLLSDENPHDIDIRISNVRCVPSTEEIALSPVWDSVSGKFRESDAWLRHIYDSVHRLGGRVSYISGEICQQDEDPYDAFRLRIYVPWRGRHVKYDISVGSVIYPKLPGLKVRYTFHRDNIGFSCGNYPDVNETDAKEIESKFSDMSPYQIYKVFRLIEGPVKEPEAWCRALLHSSMMYAKSTLVQSEYKHLSSKYHLSSLFIAYKKGEIDARTYEIYTRAVIGDEIFIGDYNERSKRQKKWKYEWELEMFPQLLPCNWEHFRVLNMIVHTTKDVSWRDARHDTFGDFMADTCAYSTTPISMRRIFLYFESKIGVFDFSSVNPLPTPKLLSSVIIDMPFIEKESWNWIDEYYKWPEGTAKEFIRKFRS